MKTGHRCFHTHDLYEEAVQSFLIYEHNRDLGVIFFRIN